MTPDETPFAWKGITMPTFGDIINVVGSIATREAAQDFMVAYRAFTPHADVNVGYISGYFGPEQLEQIQDWFGVTHPVMGKGAKTAQEAFDAGQRWAQDRMSEKAS